MRLKTTIFALLIAGCRDRAEPAPPITVFAAASLARPMRTLADSFEHRSGVPVRVELGGSFEQARKLTDLGRVPDALMLVDEDVMAALLPRHLDWYVRFATSRLAIIYTQESLHADSITADNWWRIIAREGVAVGRADSTTAPVGRHALTLLRRAERYYQSEGLTGRLLARSSSAFVRPDATQLAALLESGEVDYIIDYESVADQFGFPRVALPRDLIQPVLYGISVPRLALHLDAGVAFAAFVLSDDGRRILRDADVTILRVPVAIGSALPPEIFERVRTLASSAN